MDIRRIPLWESRNATYMSNDLVRCVVEDQGEVTLELSAAAVQGGFLNALCLPYFRGRGLGVRSDVNADWWKSKQSFYQAGGSYFSFPSGDQERILLGNAYWIVRRYGSDGATGGIWRLSEMKSREEGNRYHASKVDMLLPGQPCLYSLVRITNTGEEDLEYNLATHSMLAPPFLESGCFINTAGATFTAFAPNFREVAFNRLRAGVPFQDLRHAPGVGAQSVDAAYVPGPTGSYDYMMGNLDLGNELGWATVVNPRLQMVWALYFPGPASKLPDGVVRMPNLDIACNLAGRMDSPWALYEGGTPQVFSLTIGGGRMDHHGAFQTPASYLLKPGETMTAIQGQALTRYENPRIGQGFYTLEKESGGLVCKRTKSYAFIPCEPDFDSILALSERLFQNGQE